jgi:uncharacterized protein YcbK (DUF882 family)
MAKKTEFQFTKHFSREEMQCHCCQKIGPYPEHLTKLLALLEKLREHIGRHPIQVSSAYRCKKWNAEVGGVPESYHTQAMAADIFVEGMSIDNLANAALDCGAGGLGRYYDKEFVHVDVGPRRDWSE